MVRKGGAAAEFVYGLGLSSLQPADQVDNDEETPLRFVSVQLQLADSSKNLDVDLHAFLFEADGTYVDCVFYKNPTLAGRSVRLLQQDQELLVDLRYIPQRCSFIVCTLAIYSGGTVAQLGDCSVQLSALVPRLGLGENADFPHLPCGQIPPGSSKFYEWVCLGMLPLRPRSSLGEECGIMLCLLAHHAGFWYFKPVLKPVTAFTPQGLIDPAQDYVTRHLAGQSEEIPGIELSSLINAAREGNHMQFELADAEECLTGEPAGSHASGTPEPATLKKIGVKTGDLVGSGLQSVQADTDSGTATGRCAKGDKLGLFTRGEVKPVWHGAEEQTGEFICKDTKQHKLPTEDQGDMAVGKTTGKQRSQVFQASADSARGRFPAQVQAGSRHLGHRIADHRRDHGVSPFKSKDREPLYVGRHPEDRRGGGDKAKQKEALGTSQDEDYCGDVSETPMDRRLSDGGAIQEVGSGKRKGAEGGTNRFDGKSRSADMLTGNHGSANGEPLFISYSPVEEYGEEPCHGMHAYGWQDVAGRNDLWRESVERRLRALERSVESIGSNIQTVAEATSEMQKNNKLYIQELRERFKELKSDVASDIESALSGPLETLSLRVEEVKDDGGADAKQLAEQQRKLCAVDRMVLFLERNWHLLAQSISELRFQLSGLEQRIDQAVPAIRDSTVPPTDHAKGLPLPLESSAFIHNIEEPHEKKVIAACRIPGDNATSAPQGDGQTAFASKALEELSRIQNHAEAFGACMRRLASGTAPDGLKGLNPIERRVLSFAGTPKVFAALQELERALETINLCGSGSSGTRLY